MEYMRSALRLLCPVLIVYCPSERGSQTKFATSLSIRRNMSEPELAYGEQVVRLLRRQLKVIHRLDEIRDQYEAASLHDVLLESLRFLADETESSLGFVAYTDAYECLPLIAVDSVGLIRDDEFETVRQLANTAVVKKETVRADPRIFNGNSLA